MQAAAVIETLPVEIRLALAYAPSAVRGRWLTVLALDARLAGIVRNAREPLLGQLRLSWWRDLLARSPSDWPEGEPLVALLRLWRGDLERLIALVNGWEGLLGQDVVTVSGLEQLGDARAAAIAEIAPPASHDSAVRAGRSWALADLATKIVTPNDRAIARQLVLQEAWQPIMLPRAMRPLAVLYGLARRTVEQDGAALLDGKMSMLMAVRLGLLGH